MIEDKATERWKERAKKLGLIVNAGTDKARSRPEGGGTGSKVGAKPKKKDSKK